MHEKKKQVVLMILDGWGHREEREYNAISEAKTPYFDKFWQEYPHTLIGAGGEAVGLPEGQMGNSEVGHITIGAGKTMDTDLVRISKAVKNNELEKLPALVELFGHVKKYDSTLHLQGLVGTGGVHSHSDHLYGLIKAAKSAGIEKIAIHAFTDGRDTAPQSGSGYLRELEQVLEELGVGFIATASGRFYAMDRDNNWDRLEKAEKALFNGEGKQIQGQKPSEILEKLYQDGVVDEHLEPVVFLDENGKGYQISDNDGVIYFNFRADRTRMLSQRILSKAQEMNLMFVTMTRYDDNFNCQVAFKPMLIETTLAAEISKAGLHQAHIAETEKFAHVTYYLNGGEQKAYENEEDILIDSHKDVPTHDLAPKMRAMEIADKAVEQIDKGTEFIVINFANADMVGHTANREALIEAVEEVDTQINRVMQKALEAGAVAIITADHGNAEIYFDVVADVKHTAHTDNQVPFIIADKDLSLKESGTLADIAPTVLELLAINKPVTMTGNSLIK